MTPRQRFLRPPSIEDYARMNQAARLAAARLVADQTRAIEERRARIGLITRPHLHADEYTPEETRDAATLLARIYADTYRDTTEQQQQRRTRLVEDAAAWADPRTRKAREAA